MQQPAISRIRVYLVEDQTLLRETLGTMLANDPGLEVVGEMGDAEGALRELETLETDAVLMDIKLPGMDGIEATRKLKERHPDLAVVVLTSYEGEYFEAAIGAGATGYIMKSCKPEQLIQAVRLACQGHLLIDPSITRGLARELNQLRQAHRAMLLTPRHVEILKLVASGRRYKEIAGTLYASERTIHREVRTIFDRLGVKDAAHAVSEAYKLGII